MHVKRSHPTKEQTVARHRVVHAGTRENQSVVAAERRDEDGGRHHGRSHRAKHHLEGCCRDAVLCRVRDAPRDRRRTVRRADQRQHVQVRHVGHHIQQRHQAGTEHERERKISLGVLNLRRGEGDVVPCVAREERSDESRAESDNEGGSHLSRADERATTEIRRERRRIPANGEAKDDEQCERSRLHDGQRGLHDLPFSHAAEIDPGEDGDAEECDQPLRREAKLNCVGGIGAS